MSNTNNYLCYLPLSMLELDGTDLKFMISILYKMRVNKRTENVEYSISDIKGISRISFFRSIESLTAQHYLKVSKVNKTKYAISLDMESQKYTPQDIEHLTRPFRNEFVSQSIPQQAEPIKNSPISALCQHGNHDDCLSFNKSCGCECHKNKISNYM